ncbi:type I restriction enzyme HsdR N-terminal domain-containing protein [Polaribacter sp. BAL334]|uniref:type I restriction enzyme HsdR N-terminal domain-containing protein n=1 Tax=Polaribacter sp. BAL334 TaxID=1708178 RepID=UPI0018D26153|nr:type I restriction enzyme HsdR N-terminal domain-containing protein [Polaribacter sp. BAL334]MBG7612978.1 type I restriction enzyme HsdR N-terminal domain-containing protein [Polaribacter sp. BAL334]
MQKLNLPSYSFKLKSKENKTLIFDKFRKKYVVLTPEEWVRQHVAYFLLEEKKYPISLISVEKQFLINTLKKRTDIIIFNALGNPEIMVECKAPSVKITQETFDQIARYNLKIKANYLFVTNGLDHFYCQMDFENETYIFLEELPDFIKKTL